MQVRLSGSQTCPALNFKTHTPHIGAQNKRKQICHLDHYPPSPTASADHPESSYSLYSAVQESRRLIRNLAETTHRGALPFNRESEAFTLQMEALAPVNVRHDGRSAARQPGFIFLICIRTLMHKQTSHLYSTHLHTQQHPAQPVPPVQRHALTHEYETLRVLLQTGEPMRISGAWSLPLTR